MRRLDDLNVLTMMPLVAPQVLKAQFPLTEVANTTVFEAREAIKRIVRHQDPRLLLVVGPCSIHDPAAALEYAAKLHEAHCRFQDRLFIVMRVFMEKPRTTTGWRGFINDPLLDGSFDMSLGLSKARELLLQINNIGMPTAAEMLDPISPQYISDLVSMTAIGARTVESQPHRAMASGLSMPVGYKNSTDGNIQVAVNACLSATTAHSFLGITQEGISCVVKTAGNPDGMVILRGSRTGGVIRSNYDSGCVLLVEEKMREAGVQPAIMIDCSHANSNYDYIKQEVVWNTVLEEHLVKHESVVGMMLESNLNPGKQSVPDDRSQLKYGVSITDGCVGWETTEQMLRQAYDAMAMRIQPDVTAAVPGSAN